MGRRSVWSDPRLIELAGSFVAAADETWRLQRGDDGECRFFQAMVSEEGHYRGPGGTRQGIYVCSPSGELLSSLNSLDADLVIAALELGLERWRELPRARRRLAPDSPVRPAHRWEESFPEDGLVLTSVRRDLPADGNPFAARAERWNRDPVWFAGEEARGWLPEALVPGSTRRVAPLVVRRLARFHVVDNARGQTLPYAPDEVADSWIESRVERVEGEHVFLALRGETHAASDGVWRLGDNDWKPKGPGPFPRRIDTLCAGSATYDLASGRFVAFELTAIGERSGRTPNNGRRDDDEGPIGFVFRLEESARRIAPAFVDLYDASWIRRPGD